MTAGPSPAPARNRRDLRRCALSVHAGDGSGTSYVFDQPHVTIGALADNDVVLADARVSRYHARLTRDENGFRIEDLRSLTGTWVDHVRVRDAYLRSGCQLTFGDTVLRFSTLPEGAPTLAAQEPGRVGGLIGSSEAMRRLQVAVARVAPGNATVVLEGETGTGKEIVARTLHALSPRAAQPFVVIDCSAVAASLLESELFGHERGSFTGALAQRRGLFEAAHGGTVFLDEVGELPLDLQPKLLRALETREIRRVGGNQPIPIDVRVLAASHRDLGAEVRAGRFREDLFYRLGVVRLQLPPLRERRDDIRLLAEHLLREGRFNRLAPASGVGDGMAGRRVHGISQEALALLHSYDWPGNVRELNNIIERACSFADGDLLEATDLPESIRGAGEPQLRRDDTAPTVPLRPRHPTVRGAGPRLDLKFHDAKEAWLATFERDYLAASLAKRGGNLSQAARDAGLDRKHFRRLARKHHLIAHGPEDDATP